NSEEQKRKYLEIVSRKYNSVKQLLDELFNVAKIEANEFLLKEELMDFAGVTRESIIEFLHELKKEEIELIVSIPEEDCLIMADHQSLILIIGNLLKHDEHNGKDRKVLGIELKETNNDFQLLIWDQGSGISNVDIGNVFERMYRSDYSRNNSFGGSGLGLSIAKELVEKNHGRIWVES